jgi:hypothetical protein
VNDVLGGFSVALAEGVLGGVVASLIWFAIVRRFRPRVSVSPKLAWDGKHTWIKLINKSPRAVVDIQVATDVVTPRSAKGGIWFQTHTVEVVGKVPLFIPSNRRNGDDDNAYRFMLNLDPNDLFTPDSMSTLRFRLFARDEVSGVGKLIEQEFTHRTDVESGEFEKGQNFDIY